MIQFYRASKQSYWLNKSIHDDIMLGDYLKEGKEGCCWEFMIVSEDVGLGKSIKVEIFEDAVKALRVKKVVMALTKLEGLKYLDDVEQVLESFGIKQIIK